MCHFITATLSRGANVDLAAQSFRAHALGFKAVHNSHVSPQLNTGETYVLTTRGPCDCGTVMGSLNRDRPSDPTYSSEVAKLSKKGWSRVKIERWLEQKKEVEDKRKREDHARLQEGTAEAERWIDLVTDLLRSGQANKVGVLYHWYHGSIESERINISERRRVKVENLNPKYIMSMSEDILYEFVL